MISLKPVMRPLLFALVLISGYRLFEFYTRTKNSEDIAENRFQAPRLGSNGPFNPNRT